MSLLCRTFACLFFFVLVSDYSWAQLADTTTYKLDWQNYKVFNIDGKEKGIISFYKAAHTPRSHYLPLYSLTVRNSHVSSVEVKDGQWVELTAAENAHLSNDLREHINPQPFINNGWAGKSPSSTLSFIPLRRNLASGTVEKLIRFRLEIVTLNAIYPQSSNATSRRVNQARLGDAGSVLSQGEWYKLGFPSSGIYKIDYTYLRTMGINPDSIDPRRIQLWTNGGGMLPELIDSSLSVQPTDLAETPLFVSGENDGKFDPLDYVLFYVKGPNTWRKSDKGQFYEPINHLYSAYSYCFLTVASTAGKRIKNSLPTTALPEATFSSYSSRFVYERDLINLLASGRRWYGEEFDDRLDQTFTIPSTGILPGRQVYIQSSLMNKSTDTRSSSFQASLNGSFVNTYNLEGSGVGNEAQVGFQLTFLDSISSDFVANTKNLLLNYRYSKSSGGLGTGYLDYFSLNFEESLTVKSNPMDFRHIASQNYNTVGYTLEKGIANEPLLIWDISDLSNIYQIEAQVAGGSTSFIADSKGIVREYITFFGNKFPNPSTQVSIPNQNLAATSVPNLLIVTYPLFKAQAEKLAELRRRHDKMDVVVATTEEVYNEFSSGAQDLVAIRNFAKMYHNRENPNHNTDSEKLKFKYLLLFGDASYDYKNILGYSTPSSYVPIYESEVSLLPLYTYSSDDYVGMLSPGEGIWEDNAMHSMDIGVGRLPVKTQSEAESVVNKLIAYSTSTTSLGSWRHNLTYVCDNMETAPEIAFIQNAEELSSQVEEEASEYNIKKIYVGAYQKEISPSGVTAPGATRDINTYLNTEGSLLINYIGHGGYNQWASENILNIPQIQALTNFNKLAFFVTATCNFGQYDNPRIISGGEILLLEPQGGAIGLLTTTRAVFQHTNEQLNDAFHRSVFVRDSLRKHIRMGDVLRLTKNNSLSTGTFTRNFGLLGDPSMMLAYPKDTIVITKINDRPYFTVSDTLKAKSKVTISGEIRNSYGVKKQDFNGVVNVLVYDKKTSTKTVDQYGSLPIIPFQVLETKIFDGLASVKNGEFSFTLVIPRNINYNVGFGKISLYANSENGNMDDAGLGENGIFVGGSDTSTQFDNTPPVVKLFMNDESFVSGGFTNDHPVFLVKLYDEQGISSVGSTGRSITATLNNEVKSDVVLDSYYKTDRDTYKSGTVRYQLSNLKEGANTIKVKAFDTDTNSATANLDFVVATTKDLALKNILNYPNPFTTNTAFHFDHNRPGDNLDVMIQVFTVAGRLVKTLNTYALGGQTHFSELHWDGKDDYGDEIGRGVYVYKVSVRAQSDGSKIEEYQKLVILN